MRKRNKSVAGSMAEALAGAVENKPYPQRVVEAAKQAGIPIQQIMARKDIEVAGLRVGESLNFRGKKEEYVNLRKVRDMGIIDEWNYIYGLQLRTIWEIAGNPPIRALNFEGSGGGHNPEYYNISLMSAQDEFFKILHYMTSRDWDIVYLMACKDRPKTSVAREIGVRLSSINGMVKSAFDALGCALVQVRKFKDELFDGKVSAVNWESTAFLDSKKLLQGAGNEL